MVDPNEKPAIFGGPKVNDEPIPMSGHGVELYGEEEEQAVLAALRARTLCRICHPLEESPAWQLETALREMLDVPYVLAVNSCGSALQAAVVALGIGVGDEVILSDHGWVSCTSAVINAGAMPVVANTDTSLTIDPDDIVRKITPRTRAIMVVHWNGMVADMDRIMAIAREHGLFVIEDVAQSLGAEHKGRWIGTIGHVGCYSLNMHKTITAGEGGFIAFQDKEVFARALAYTGTYAYYYQNRYPEFVDVALRSDMTTPPLNLRIPELCAAVALAQLPKLRRVIDLQRARRDEVVRGIAGVAGLQLAPHHELAGNCGYTLPFVFERQAQAAFFFDALHAEGINNASCYDLGFYGGQHLGSVYMANVEQIPPERILGWRFAKAFGWYCMKERRGLNERHNPWVLAGVSTEPLPDDFMDASIKALRRVVVLKFNVMSTEAHTAKMVAALRKIAPHLDAVPDDYAPKVHVSDVMPGWMKGYLERRAALAAKR